MIRRRDSNVEASSVETQPTSLSTRIISGSVGSIVTSLAVTPLEVVKVRQQSSLIGGEGGSKKLPRNVRPCPKGCGTFVLNNGQLDCILPKSIAPYFDKDGNLTPKAREATNGRNNLGTFAMVRKIFAQEGYAGIYAGLRPTLIMAVPNTVMYFSAYEEIMNSCRSNMNSFEAPPWMPLVAGGFARLLASSVTAPFEFLRTRQASITATSGSTQISGGIAAQFRNIIQTDGAMTMFRGLPSTLWRDVPFSAVYWFFLEQFRSQWRLRAKSTPTPLEQAGQALCNGALAGMIAAAFTTPFDVLKTRQQQALNPVVPISSAPPEPGLKACCTHNGAVVYPITSNSNHSGTFTNLRRIAAQEGVAALWTGNQARMLKVAPACAIMLSCYEFGKRIL